MSELIARGKQVLCKFYVDGNQVVFRFCPDTWILDVRVNEHIYLQTDAAQDYGLCNMLYDRLNCRDFRAAEEMVAEFVMKNTAKVTLFKVGGKYYTDELWRVPESVPLETRAGTRKAIGPFDMMHSPDFRTIDGGPVLVPSQEPWGFPFLIVQA